MRFKKDLKWQYSPKMCSKPRTLPQANSLVAFANNLVVYADSDFSHLANNVIFIFSLNICALKRKHNITLLIVVPLNY